jgi:hypothetical protein
MFRFRYNYINENIPPILVYYSNDQPVYDSTRRYIIGSEQDPHWKTYPKSQYPYIKNAFPINTAVTDYPIGNNKYLAYMTPNQDSTSREYGLQLKKTFDIYHKQLADKNNEIRQQALTRQQEENKENVKRIRRLLTEQKNNLKLYEKEFKNAKLARDRFIRINKRQGLSEDEANGKFIRENPGVIQLEPTINAINQNIITLNNELKSYK